MGAFTGRKSKVTLHSPKKYVPGLGDISQCAKIEALTAFVVASLERRAWDLWFLVLKGAGESFIEEISTHPCLR